MKFNGKEITEKTILKTREHFISIENECLNDVVWGTTKVNDPEKYIESGKSNVRSFKSGEFDHTLTFMQRAYYLQEGESIPLLP